MTIRIQIVCQTTNLIAIYAFLRTKNIYFTQNIIPNASYDAFFLSLCAYSAHYMD